MGWRELRARKAEEWWKTRGVTRESLKGRRKAHARVHKRVTRKGNRLSFGFIKCF